MLALAADERAGWLVRLMARSGAGAGASSPARGGGAAGASSLVVERRRRGGPAGDDGRVGIGLDLVGGGVGLGRDDVLGRPERRRRRPRVRVRNVREGVLAVGAEDGVVRVAPAQRCAAHGAERRVADAAAHLAVPQLFGAVLVLPSGARRDQTRRPCKSRMLWSGEGSLQYASVAWGRSAAVARSTCASS